MNGKPERIVPTLRPITRLTAPRPSVRMGGPEEPLAKGRWRASILWSSPARRVCSVLIFLAAWQVVGSLLNSLFLPPVFRIFRALYEMLGTGMLWSGLGETAWVWAIATLCSILVGVLLGLVTGFWAVGNSVLGPIVDFLNAVPAVAFLPLWIIWSGTSRVTDITFAMVLAMPVTAYNVRDGARSADPVLSDMVRSFSASRLQSVRFVQFWAALPLALAGMRVTAGRCFIGVIVSQELLTGSSLGDLLSTYGGSFDTKHLWALNLIILAMAYLFGETFTVIENLVLRDRFVPKEL